MVERREGSRLEDLVVLTLLNNPTESQSHIHHHAVSAYRAYLRLPLVLLR
jgi:hypothetical protein